MKMPAPPLSKAEDFEVYQFDWHNQFRSFEELDEYFAKQIEKAEEPKQIFEQHEKTKQPKNRKQKKESEGIKLTPEMEAKVNEKVEEMLHSEKESKEENKENI